VFSRTKATPHSPSCHCCQLDLILRGRKRSGSGWTLHRLVLSFYANWTSEVRTVAIFIIHHITRNLESELLYDWRLTANKFALATSFLRLTTSNFIFQLNTCVRSPYVTSSMTRGWVCRLQLLLVLASSVHDHILLSQIQPGAQVPAFISPRNRVARLYPQALGSLFVAFYDSHGHGGGIRSRLHTGNS
jgi:hypothetical protein